MMLPLRLGGEKGRPASFLFIGAHCDDIEIGCGATVLRLVEEHPDAAFHWVIFNSDERREAETRHAAELLLAGAKTKELIIKTFRNAYFPYLGAGLKDFFEELKGLVSPDVIFTHHREDRHQDHRVLSDLTWNSFRSHLIFEYEIVKFDGDLGHPNLFVPATEAAMRRKIEILMDCYGSQRSHQWFTPDTFSGLMRIRGVECDSPTGYAEAFYARKLTV